jgi:triacylglycerol lipase
MKGRKGVRPRFRVGAISHCNFASPRVLDPTLANNCESLPIKTLRVVNLEDIVPTVPRSSFGPIDFQHVGTSIYFSAKQAPHSMVTYTYALEHPKNPEKPAQDSRK